MSIIDLTEIEIEFSSFLDKIDKLQSKDFAAKNKKLLDKAEKLLSDISQRELRSIYFYKRGIYEFYRTNYIIARERLLYSYYNLNVIKNEKSDLSNTRILLALGVTYQKQGLYHHAITAFQKALVFAIKINNKEYIAKLSNWKAICYSNFFVYDKALELNFIALDLFIQLDNKEWIANVYNSLALAYSKLEDNEHAIEYFGKAQKINLEFDYKDGEANVLNNLGLLYEKNGEFDKALRNFNKAIEVRKRFAGKVLLAQTYSNIAQIYYKQKKFKESINTAKLGYDIAFESDDYSSMHRCKLMIGYNYVEMKQFDYVEKIISDIDRLSKTLTNDSFYLSNYTFCTYYYENRQDLTNALKYQKLITETSSEISNNKLISQNKLLQNIHDHVKRKQIKSIYREKNLELSKTNNNLKNTLHKLDVTNHILRHDLTNHLVVINSAIRLIDAKKDLSYLEQIGIRTNESIELIQSLAKISSSTDKLDDPKNKLDLQEIIQNVMKSNKSIQYIIDGKATILANKKIKSVINNLVDNAIRHGKTKKIDFIIKQFSNRTSLSVIDFGKGIPSNISDKIFQKDFYHGDSGNTGMGLFIAKEVVAENNGKLVYKPNQPNGAIFEMELYNSEV